MLETARWPRCSFLIALLLGAACDADSDESPASGTSGNTDASSSSSGEDSIPPEVCQTLAPEVDCGTAAESCVFDDDNHRVCDPIENEADAVACVVDGVAAGTTVSLDSGFFVQDGDSMDVHYVVASDGSGWLESHEVSGGACTTDMLYAWGPTDLSDCSTIECLRIRFESTQTDVCTDDFACE